MGIIATIVIGFLVGLVARAVMPGKDPAGFILTTVLGVAGAIVGTYAGQSLGMYQQGQPAGFVMSVVGAMVLLVVVHLFRNRPATT